ncbi:MAG: cold-shock protein [Alphaproteobacteria bacterium]|nr:cold-shock protein [Alphaproteobacteria bacterium]
MLLGTVKWFNATKGYGFITPNSGEKDIFVHITQIQKCGLKNLMTGQNIGYEKYDDRGRTAAGNLQLL